MSKNFKSLLPTKKQAKKLVRLKRLLALDGNIKAREERMSLQLISAAWNGEVDIVAFCLENGAGLESRDNMSWTPLVCAAVAGHLKVANILLKGGAKVNARVSGKEKEGWTKLGFW